METRVLLSAALALLLAAPASAGSCRAAKLCCQGRDSGCVIQKPSPNAIIESPRDKPCYCDHACLELGDCCPDFNDTCAASDCAVGEWSDWTACDNGCGAGGRTRRRSVVRPARNGGRPCPEIEQTSACQSYDACRRRARHFQVQEASFSPDWLNLAEEATSDGNFVPGAAGGYCTAFTILKISKGCRRRLESFHEGSRACVWCGPEAGASCQPARPALHGIGRWELRNPPAAGAAVKHCHGKWLAEPGRDDCSVERCRGGPLLAFL